MSELLKATSGANTSTSGDVNAGGVSNSTSGESDNSIKQIEKILKEKKNYVMAYEKEKSEKDEIAKKLAAYEEAEMLKNKQTEQLLANYKEKLAKVESDLKAKEEAINAGQKNSAFISELKKLGFNDTESNREAALKLASLKSMAIDPATNSVVGADIVAKDFLEKFSQLGFFEKKTGATSSQAPQFNFKQGMTPDFSKMNKEEKFNFLASLGKK